MQICPGVGYLARLQQVLPEAVLDGADDIRLSGCVCDARRVRPGDIFVAIRGSEHDGHAFIAEAIQRGCAAVLSDRPRPVEHAGAAWIAVPDARDAFGRLCHALAGRPTDRLKLIGVTGTNGKTTTATLIAGILARGRMKAGLLGTLGYFDGDEVEDAHWTTPPADHLAQWMRRMVDRQCSHAVMEVSSHALDQSRTAGMQFDAACVTNVTHDHLDYHASLADYRLSKSKLFAQLKPEGFAVINADDPVSAGFLRQIDGPVLTVGIHRPAEITATLIEQFPSEQTFLLSAGSETVPVRTRMIGRHHVYNCLTAAAVGLTYGVDLMTVVRGLEQAEHVPGRLERIECGQPFSVFVDYAHTPDALEAVLTTLRGVIDGRLICVFGAGGDRDMAKRPLMGAAAERHADRVILTADNPRGEDPATIVDDIREGMSAPADVAVQLDRRAAIHQALAEAQPGDAVLIAGKGHEQVQIVGDRATRFSDAATARQWLYDVQPHADHPAG
jgi:UDP-N-acetylmuramoyl-L-alanyl-D-glutamate--2,6-diaminopimelate ligase